MDCEGRCDENFVADTHASDNKRVTFSPLIIVLNSDHGGGCGRDSETNREGTECSSPKSPDSSDTESSSLSNSSFDGFIQINPQILQKSSGENSTSRPTGSTKLSYVIENCNVTSEDFHRLEEFINKSPESTSQSSDVTHESESEHMLPTVYPSIQMMQRPEGFDRNEISASLSGRPSTTVEGSAASDDSLFSIHIGNKAEDAFRMDEDLYKSKKQPKTGELFKSGKLKPNRKLDMAKAIGEDVKPRENGMVYEPINDISMDPMNNQVDANVGDSRDSSSAKCQSDKVEISFHPLAFPVKKKSSHLLWHCPDCCSAFHCFKWPSRSSSKWILWPGCSKNCLSWLGCCCKWPSCYCKCPVWSSCCVKCKH